MFPIIGIVVVLGFFFFQAEDGIRDHCVTGVQTCALPILPPEYLRKNGAALTRALRRRRDHLPQISDRYYARSEERRVGKECRSWWAGHPYKKRDAANRVGTERHESTEPNSSALERHDANG